MAKVTNPPNGGSKDNGTFTWDMTLGGAPYYTASKVVVGYPSGSDNFYSGSVIMKVSGQNVYTDNAVHHPGGNQLCYTRPKYSKVAGGGNCIYTLLTTVTSFTSIKAFP